MSVKIMSSVALAGVIIAGVATAPVYATSGDVKDISVKNDHNSVQVHKDACTHTVKVDNQRNHVEVNKTKADCKDADADEDKGSKAVSEQSGTGKVVSSSASTTAPATTPTATAAPTELPKTGPANLLAIGGSMTALGYAVNLLRLRFMR